MSVPLIDRMRSRTRGHGQHRAVDEVVRLRAELDQERACSADLRRQLNAAKDGWDAANAKVSQLGEVEAQLAETTQHATRLEAEVTALRAQLANTRKAGDLTAHPAVTETQWIPVLPLHLSPLAGGTKPEMESK